MRVTKPVIFASLAGVTILSLFVVALLLGRLEREPEVTNAVKAGSAATASVIYAASFSDTAGKQQSLAQWSGKLLVINFWATWCAPCLEEIPLLIKMQEKYGSQGLQIVGIAADSHAKSFNFAQKMMVNYPILPDESRAIEFSKRVGNRLGLLPFTIAVSPSGEILLTKLGVITEVEMDDLIRRGLRKDPRLL